MAAMWCGARAGGVTPQKKMTLGQDGSEEATPEEARGRPGLGHKIWIKIFLQGKLSIFSDHLKILNTHHHKNIILFLKNTWEKNLT